MTSLGPDQDTVRRYLFDLAPDIRVMTVRLQQTCREMLAHQNMPRAVSHLCNEMAAAVSILTHMVKFEGQMIIQLKGEGPINMLVAECSSNGILRATSQWTDVDDTMTFRELVGKGILAITIDPLKGERYQGIIRLDQDTLSDCLNIYFKNSEQLNTKIWLSADDETAGGLLIQKIAPTDKGQSIDQSGWTTADALASTLTVDELISTAGPLLAYRLFHKLEPRTFEPWPVQFGCSCSRDRSARAIRSLGEAEVKSLFNELHEVLMNCHFCGRVYQYDQADLEWLLSDQPPRSEILQ